MAKSKLWLLISSKVFVEILLSDKTIPTFFVSEVKSFDILWLLLIAAIFSILTKWSADIVNLVILPVAHLDATLSVKRSCKAIIVSKSDLTLTDGDQMIVLWLKVCVIGVVILNYSGVSIEALNDISKVEISKLWQIMIVCIDFRHLILLHHDLLNDTVVIIVLLTQVKWKFLGEDLSRRYFLIAKS